MDLNQFMANYFMQHHILTPGQFDVAKALLAASGTGSWQLCIRQRLLELAEKLTEDPIYARLRVEIIRRRSVLMRLGGDVQGSGRAITTFLLNIRWKDLAPDDLAALYVSQANNHAYHFDFIAAHTAVKGWAPLETLPGRQDYLLWDQVFCVGRILRGEGCFEGAKTCFETCLATPGLNKSRTFLVKSALADLYCELAYLAIEPVRYLSQAEAMIKPEIQGLRLMSGQNLKGYRRLLLALAEVQIRQGHAQDANLLVRELLALYGNLPEMDVVDRLGHVRALISLARISPMPEDAVERWKDAFDVNRLYNPLEEEVFTCGVINLFLCISWHTLGNTGESFDCFRRAMGVIEKKPRQFLIPGVGTYLFNDVCVRVQSMTGWFSVLQSSTATAPTEISEMRVV